jgi:uncharacterized protein YyaL (SSP411 family)
VLSRVAPILARHPLGFGHALQALDFALARVREVAIIGAGDDAAALLTVVRGRFDPHLVYAGAPEPVDAAGAVALLADRPLVEGRAAAYVCEAFVCRAPVTEPSALADALA